MLDCANGATYHIAPAVFKELGAEIIVIGDKPNGTNINHQCGATHMDSLQQAVIEQQADLGIAFDGDGDRVMMVDSNGEIVDGDELLFIIARDALRTGYLKGGAVGTQMTNLGVENAFKALGIPFVRAKVGDRYVMEALKEKGWIYGGEGSGHIICLDKTTTGDGIVSALQVLAAICISEMPLADLRKGVEKYPQLLLNVNFVPGTDPLNAATVQQAVAEAEAELAERGRVLLRKSGTEPLIRVMVEGADPVLVKNCAERIAEAVKAVKC